MQIGTLAEWVTGITNLFAVCIALFMPMYQTHKSKKEAQTRIIRMTTDLVNSLLVLKSKKPHLNLSTTKEFTNLQLLTNISSITDGDVINISVIHQLEELFQNSNQLDFSELKIDANHLLTLLKQ